MPDHLLADGVPLHYEDRGSGPVVMLVPGWTFTGRVWSKQVSELARDHRVITVDLRGAGRSGKTAAGHTLSSYAADLVSLADALALEDATLVGWALGASVAALVHADFNAARRFTRLVWVDHSPMFFSAPGWEYALYGGLTRAQLDATLALIVRDRPKAVKGLLDDVFGRGLPPVERAEFYADSFQTPDDVAAHMRAAVAHTDLRPLLGSIDVPALFVHGRDSVVPCGVGEWLADQVPNGIVTLIDDAAHAPFYDQPQAFNADLRRFVAS